MGVDLTHPDSRSMLGSVNAATRWFAEALDGPFGESLDDRAAAGEEVRLWAWLPEDGPFWLKSCEVTVKASSIESIAELVELGAAYAASEPDLQPYHSWSGVDLPAGEAARHDFGWSPTAAGTEYIFLDADRMVNLSCQDTSLEDTDAAASRDTWRSIAETLGRRRHGATHAAGPAVLDAPRGAGKRPGAIWPLSAPMAPWHVRAP